jgi:metallophosphoesterase superfamily enzyme
VIVLADWGVIEGDKMTPIMNSLNQILTRDDIHLMVIMGDIAYDLDSNYGDRYLKFLGMIEEFTRRLPIVIAPGNHEHFSDDDMMLLSTTY